MATVELAADNPMNKLSTSEHGQTYSFVLGMFASDEEIAVFRRALEHPDVLRMDSRITHRMLEDYHLPQERVSLAGELAAVGVPALAAVRACLAVPPEQCPTALDTFLGQGHPFAVASIPSLPGSSNFELHHRVAAALGSELASFVTRYFGGNLTKYARFAERVFVSATPVSFDPSNETAAQALLSLVAATGTNARIETLAWLCEQVEDWSLVAKLEREGVENSHIDLLSPLMSYGPADARRSLAAIVLAAFGEEAIERLVPYVKRSREIARTFDEVVALAAYFKVHEEVQALSWVWALVPFLLPGHESAAFHD